MSVELTFSPQYRPERTSPEVLAAATRYARALASDGKTYTVEVGRTWISIVEGGEAFCAVHAAGGGVYPASQAHHPTQGLARRGSIAAFAREAEAKAQRGRAA